MDEKQRHGFEEALLDFIADRRATMGVEDSGLFAYYSQRVEKRRALTRYERELLDYLKGDPRIVHAGIGIGALTAGLALQGSCLIGFEFDERRYAAAIALKERLAPAAAYEIRLNRFPQGLNSEDEISSATLLFTNVASSWADEAYEGVIASMQRFQRSILDLRLFGHTRNEPAERDELARRLVDSGLTLQPLPFRAANSFYVEARIAPGGQR